MIISFSIKNFRSVKDKVTLSLEPENSKDLADYYMIEPAPGQRLLKLGLIYGANGSGKTTILKGLDFLRTLVLNAPLQKQELLSYTPFLFDAETPNTASGFELTFIYKKTKYYYEISFTEEAITYERLDFYAPNKALVFERSTDQEKQLSKIKFGVKAKMKKVHENILEANTLWNNPVLTGFLRSNVDAVELRNVTEWFQKVLVTLITPKTDLRSMIINGLASQKINQKNVIKFLKKADFKINAISIEKKTLESAADMSEFLTLVSQEIRGKRQSPTYFIDGEHVERRKIHFQHAVLNEGKTANYMLPYDEESEGTQRYFQFSGLLDLMLSQENVVLIDELESSLHPDLLKHFLLLFLVNVKDSQLIATTHYRELLMERDILRDDTIWFTEKKEDGSMAFYSLSDFDSGVVRDTTSIFNAYKSGKLGAVPELSDYYLSPGDGEE